MAALEGPHAARPLGEDLGAIAFLHGSPLCHGISEQALLALIEAGRVLEYGLGAVVFKPGGKDDALYIVFDGSVSICKPLKKKLVEVAALDRAVIFGEISVLTQRPRSSTVLTRTDAKLIMLPGAVVRSVADSEPKFGRKLAALMAGRTRDTQEKLGL